MASSDSNGWNKELTWRIRIAIDNNRRYFDTVMEWVHDCEELGTSVEDARAEVGRNIRNLVEDEIFDARDKMNPLVRELMYSINLYSIDFQAVAEAYLVDYDPKWPSNAKPTGSQNIRRKPASKPKASKPKASANRAPARKSANRKPVSKKAAPRKAARRR